LGLLSPVFVAQSGHGAPTVKPCKIRLLLRQEQEPSEKEQVDNTQMRSQGNPTNTWPPVWTIM
jgi:hypothetical protein